MKWLNDNNHAAICFSPRWTHTLVMYSVESVFPSIQTEMENLRAIEKNRQILSLFLELKSNGKQIFCFAYAVFFRYIATLLKSFWRWNLVSERICVWFITLYNFGTNIMVKAQLCYCSIFILHLFLTVIKLIKINIFCCSTKLNFDLAPMIQNKCIFWQTV